MTAAAFRDPTPDPNAPGQLLRPEFLDEYRNQRQILWNQLVQLNAELFLFEKLRYFPFWLFAPFPDESTFWRFAKWSLFQTVIITSWRILCDKDDRSLTLRKFSETIKTNAADPDARASIEARLTQLDFDARIKGLEKKLKHLRHKRIAHLDLTNALSLNPADPDELTYTELRTLVDSLIDLFQALCFTEHHEVWLASYWPDMRDEGRTDIDRLLLHVADSSYLLHLPETNPAVWSIWRPRYTDDGMRWINHYRVKLGLPEVT
ncbi:MAG: hypothetical protein U0452_07765 [Anaerolineae bacterium]